MLLRVLLSAVVFLCACSGDTAGTGFKLRVLFESTLSVDQLKVTLVVKGLDPQPEPRLVPEPPQRLSSGVEVLLRLSDTWHGKQVDLTLQGLQSGEAIASASRSFTVKEGEIIETELKLESACSEACTAGETQCVGDAVRRCETDALGCLDWSIPSSCPPQTPYCSNGLCEAQCSDECDKTDDRRCDGDQGYQICGEHDSDSCKDWGPLLACAPDERCSEGQCTPDCDGKPCVCTDGETMACQDVGQCSGGQRTCTDGVFGACQWSVGPEAETCDGLDNDCNGTVDDSLVAPACAKQQGVCQGAVKSCEGSSGWVDCGAVEYAAWAAGQGLTFQADETLCDSKDNDCDGQSDEAGSCCSPDCEGKACGADDGCGNPCQTGSCPKANELCQSGVCVCQPDCVGKECGDDGCNSTCGDCFSFQNCELGICKTGDDCGLLTYKGCCLDEVVYSCMDDKVVSWDCAPYPKCGWSGSSGYDCATDGKSDPSGNYPKLCQ